ncbi:MAG: DUF6056 family protein [Firmicutes bacterium]|nr:DUF6056 family protein [Bacillota bacterium]
MEIWSKIKKILSWKPDKRLVAALAWLVLAGLLIPLFRALPDAAPYYDDYNYGLFVKNFLDLERSLGSALQGAIYCVRTQWWAWQGTFSSVFFMSMVPCVWGEEYYFLGPLFLILILLFSTLILTKVLLQDVMQADRAGSMTVQAVAAAMLIVLIYSLNDGFYWYNGGVHYVGMHSILMLLAAAWIKLLVKKTKPAASVLLMLWALLGGVLAGGANYVTALQGLLVGLSVAAVGIILKNKKVFWMLPSLAVYAYAFYKNVSAPGNNVRSSVLRESGLGMGAWEAVWRSFLEAFRHLTEYTGWITVALLVLLAPVIWQMLKNTEFRFRLPGLLLLWSFCLYATGFTPSLYTIGHAGLGRTQNAVKITFQLLLILNEVYWLGWLQGRLKGRKVFLNKEAGVWFYPVIGALMLCIFAVDPYQAAHYSSFAAYWFVHTGEGFNFRQEYWDRIETIVNGGPDVVVKPYVNKPIIFMPNDLSSDPNAGANRAMANWYHKNSISCVGEDAE